MKNVQFIDFSASVLRSGGARASNSITLVLNKFVEVAVIWHLLIWSSLDQALSLHLSLSLSLVVFLSPLDM